MRNPFQITAGSGGGGGKDKKKETQLGLSATKGDDFNKWYQELVVASELISYYDVSGCYILRPWAFAMWEVVHRWFDDHIKAMGVQVRSGVGCSGLHWTGLDPQQQRRIERIDTAVSMHTSQRTTCKWL